jgi:uncharacterized protein YggU (UPF0235/DUF167 family)
VKEPLAVKGGRVEAYVKAAPGASKSEFAGVTDGRLRIRLAEAAQDGKANKELRRFVAKELGCSRGEIALLRGERSPLKTITFPPAYLAAFEAIIRKERGE